jgi:hypothetical protein
MRPRANVIPSAGVSGSAFLLMVGTFMLATTPCCASEPNHQTIQASYTQAGNTDILTLIVYNYSTPSDLKILSQAFKDGQDRGLATALSKMKAVGHCSIAGGLSYEVAFIQMVPTPTGRKITFIASRLRAFEEADPPASPETFDLAVGQFDLNDTDTAKNTGFLYPASKLVINQQGEVHYDLAGSPWSLVTVLDSQSNPAGTERVSR